MKIQARHIDNGFYQITAQEAKRLTVDGELPTHGHQKRAKPLKEINQMVDFILTNGKTHVPAETNPAPWIQRTMVWCKEVWAISVYESP